MEVDVAPDSNTVTVVLDLMTDSRDAAPDTTASAAAAAAAAATAAAAAGTAEAAADAAAVAGLRRGGRAKKARRFAGDSQEI